VKVFAALGRLTTRHPFVVIAIWLALTITSAALAIGGVGGQGIFDKLEPSEIRVPGSGSEKASAILDESAGGSSVRLLVKGVNVTDAAVMSGLAKPMASCRTDLTAISGVSTVVDPWAITPPDPRILPFIASDGKGFVIQVVLADGLSGDDERAASDSVTARLRTFGSDVTAAVPGATSIASSSHLIMRDINDVMESDLVRAEAVSLPISLVVMVLVFGGLLAAGMPIIGAIASILGGFGAVLALSYAMKLDSVTVNVVTVIGLGLSIDYGLLMVSRFREELAAAGAPLTGPGEEAHVVEAAGRRNRHEQTRAEAAIVSRGNEGEVLPPIREGGAMPVDGGRSDREPIASPAVRRLQIRRRPTHGAVVVPRGGDEQHPVRRRLVDGIDEGRL